MSDDFGGLEQKAYAGRVVCVGRMPTGNMVAAYAFTGRGDTDLCRKKEDGKPARQLTWSSESRVLSVDLTDPSMLSQVNPALMLYPAMAFTADGVVISNGRQTNVLYTALLQASSSPTSKTADEISHMALCLKPAMEYTMGHSSYEYDSFNRRWIDNTNYEPDSPQSPTPRISAILRSDQAVMHIVRRGADGQRNTQVFECYLQPGELRILHTYAGGDDKILTPFTGNPLSGSIQSTSAAELSDHLYDAILGAGQPQNSAPGNYRIGAAVFVFDTVGKILDHAVVNRIERGN